MGRRVLFSLLIFMASISYAQQHSILSITGRLPNAASNEIYRIQVGAFRVSNNAERVIERLRNINLNPATEIYNDFTRVIIFCNAIDVPAVLERISSAGFTEAFIRVEPSFLTPVQPSRSPVRSIRELPVSTALIPPSSFNEIASQTIKIGETRSLRDLAQGRNITAWTSSTPSAATVDSSGNVTGINLGNTYISINNNEYISIAVVPQEDFFIVPEQMTSLLPASNRRDSSFSDFTEYRTEPTFRLAYRFNNKGEHKGASGENGGIDILARGEGYNWLWTTFYQGGWFYDLNGVKREMIDGYQRGANGVSLTIVPEFVYEKGTPYLQLRHLLHNTNNFAVTNQRFGASADVMIHNNDYASLLLTPYGAYMTDNPNNPSMELMFVCLTGNGITPVDTLWLGTYSSGSHLHLDYIYTDRRINVQNQDSAIGFSYQNIDLGPGETKEFIVRFTLARHED